jgi:dienelactone hydrolase
MSAGTIEKDVTLPAAGVALPGNLDVPAGAGGVVVFAHGSGSSRFSPRNREVAAALRARGCGTLLIDLLTPEEDEVDRHTRHLRFDIPMLAERVAAIGDWVLDGGAGEGLSLGYFGASTGAGAALIAAAGQGERVAAVVSRGGRPDLAGEALGRVSAPTLLIVGGNDPEVLDLNRQALQRLNERSRLEVVPGATHLFEEPGKLEAVADLAADWFARAL